MPSFSFAATANAVALAGATPGVRRHRAAPLLPRPGGGARRDRRRAPRRSCRCTSTGTPPRWTASPSIAAAARPGAGRGRRAGPPRRAAADAPVGTFGDGGGLQLLPDEEHDRAGRAGSSSAPTRPSRGRVRLLRNQGMERRYANEIVGYNARMTDLHAAIGRVQLRRLPGWTAARRRNAAYLTAALRRLGELPGSALPAVAPGRRTGVAPVHGARSRRATGSSPRSPGSASRPACTTRRRSTGCRPTTWTSTCRQTAAAAREVLSLPVHPALTPAQLRADRRRRVSQALAEAMAAMSAHAAGRPDRARHDGPQPRPRPAVAARTSSWSRPSTRATRPQRPATRVEVLDTVARAPRPRHRPVRGRHARPARTRRSASNWPRPGSPTLIEKPLAHDAKAAQTIAEAFARNGVIGLRRAHRAVQPGAAGHAARLAARRARRRLPGGHPAPGAVPGPHRRRRRRPRPGHPRHRPHGVGDRRRPTGRSRRGSRTAAAGRTRTW